MPNSMVDFSECGGDDEVKVPGNNEEGIRSHDEGGDDCDSDSNSDSTAGLNGDQKRKLPAVVGGGYPAKYNSRGSSSEGVLPLEKSKEGDFGTLGPDTKDTELRLGLPELGSERASIPVGRLRILQGGRIKQNLPGTQLNAFVPRCSLDFQARPNSIQGLDYASKEQLKLKPMFREFTVPNPSFDVRFTPLALPPAKRIFCETLHANRGSASGELPPPGPAVNSKFCFPAPWPASLFNLPSPGGPMNWAPHNQNQTGAYGQFSGHMGSTEIKTNEPALPLNTPPPDQKGNPEQTEPSTEQRPPRIIGWPPVQPRRRNLPPQLRIAPAAPPPPPPPHVESLPVVEPPPPPPPVVALPADEPPPPPPPMVAPLVAQPQPQQQRQPANMFVKVNVDGVPFGRKIDLNAYASYDELFLGLDEMFRDSIHGLFSLRGGDYVLVYQDDEGDRMLVGDVPWRMFVTTVRRLRMLRSSEEARGLGIHGARPTGGAHLNREPA